MTPTRENHPELRQGEVLLTNTSMEAPPHDPDQRPPYDRIGWKTKRLGVGAYDKDGQVVPKLRPVFVQFHEVIEANIDLGPLYETHEEWCKRTANDTSPPFTGQK